MSKELEINQRRRESTLGGRSLLHFYVLPCHLFARLEGTCLVVPSPAHLWGWTAVSVPRERAKIECAKGLSSAWGSGQAPLRWGGAVRGSGQYGAWEGAGVTA